MKVIQNTIKIYFFKYLFHVLYIKKYLTNVQRKFKKWIHFHKKNKKNSFDLHVPCTLLVVLALKHKKPFSKGFWSFFLESINTKKWLEFQKKTLNSKKHLKSKKINLIKSDQIWSKPTFWSDLIRFDQIWSDLIRFDQIWSDLIRFVFF